MNKALICVDVQPDFLPGGPLGVPDGHLTIRPLIELMEQVDIIVLTRDWHPANHVSFSTTPEFADGSWPTHCVAGTPGAQIDDELWHAAIDTGKPVLLVHKGWDADKEAYSGFQGGIADVFNRDALSFPVDDLLWQYDGDDDNEGHPVTLQQAFTMLSVTEVHVGGLALDYCVKATALDADRIGYRTQLHLEATRPVTWMTGADAITHMVYTSNVAVS